MRYRSRILTVFLVPLLTVPLCVTAAALSAESPGVDVLALPEPQINNIDAAKNIIHMAIDVDPNASADFRAGVLVEDVDGNILEVSPQIAVIEPGDIKVPIRTELAVGYKITPEISNNNVKNTGAGGVHSEPEVEEPKVEEPKVEEPSSTPEEPPEPTVIIKTQTQTKTKTRTDTRYVITEIEGEQVVIEKIVEVATPVPMVVDNGINGLESLDGQTDTSIRDIVASDTETIEKIAEVLNPSPIPVTESGANRSWISANTKLLLFWLLAILGVILFVVNVYLTHANRVGAARLEQA